MITQTSQHQLVAEARRCLVLALPLIGAQLAQAATGFVDTLMMGRLGRESLAAGALGSLLFMELLVVGTNLVATSSSFIAESYGAQQPERAGRWLNQGVWLAVAIAIPLALVMWNSQPWLRLLGQSPAVVTLAGPYLRAASIAYLPALVFVALRSFVSALFQPRVVLVLTLGGVVLNAIADEALAFGRWGCPQLGLAGIGWSTACIYWSMALTLVVYVLSQRQFDQYRPLRGLHRPHWADLWELLRVSLPVAVLSAFETASFAVTAIFAGQMGVTVLAAHQIALQTVAVTFMVPLGIAHATTVRVGQCLGQRDWQTARLAGTISLGLGGGFMGLMGVLILLIPRQVVSIYLDLSDPANQEVMALAMTLLAVGAIFQVVDGLQVVAAGALRGLKDTRIPMAIGLVAYWVVGVPSGYSAGFTLGLGGVGLWYGLAIGLAIAAVALTWRFYQLTAVEPMKPSSKL